jgi:ADP-ribose pyrophosphatase YjhB (NUDIX family)
MPKLELIARGLLILRGQVLLCRGPEGYTYLPGGHVEHGEPAATALAREFREECTLKVAVKALLLVHEHRFTTPRRGGKSPKLHHEINLVFHVEHSSRALKRPAIASREPNLTFVWADRDNLDTLRPVAMRRWIIPHLTRQPGQPAPIAPEWMPMRLPPST